MLMKARTVDKTKDITWTKCAARLSESIAGNRSDICQETSEQVIGSQSYATLHLLEE